MPELVKLFYVRMLHINIALVNHSCAPNAKENGLWPIEQVGDEDSWVELRAIKNEARR